MNASTTHKIMATALVMLMLIQMIQIGASLSPKTEDAHLHSIDDAATASLVLPFTTAEQQQQAPCSNSADAEKESELNTTDEFITQKGVVIPFFSAHTYERLKVAVLTLFSDPVTPPPRA